jgi:hypothetical protein
VLELEPPRLGAVKIEPELPELLELLDPLSLALLELLESSELLLELELDEPFDEELLEFTALAVADDACVSPHIPAKRPSVAAATPARRPTRAANRAAAVGRRALPVEAARGAATRRPAVASVRSPSGSATQLST